MDLLDKLLKSVNIDPQPYYNPKEVSIITKTPESSVRRWLREGNLKASKIGQQYKFIFHEDLANFLGE